MLNSTKKNLLCELGKVKDEDMRLKTLLCRKEQNCLLLNEPQNCIEQSTCCLGKVEDDPFKLCYSNFLRNTGERMRVNSYEHYRSCSPRY